MQRARINDLRQQKKYKILNELLLNHKTSQLKYLSYKVVEKKIKMDRLTFYY